MTINLRAPDILELRPHITVFGCGGAGGNAVNNMIESGLMGCEFVVANTDAQALTTSKAERRIQMGLAVTQGLGAGAQPEVGRAAAEEVIDEIRDHLAGAHMVFITAGMGGGTGTGAAPVVASVARDLGILTVGVVTKPFQFEGTRRMRLAESGIIELQKSVDTLIVIPNQNLFRIANEKTTFADAFAMADQVLYSGVASITDLMVKEGLINLDFADVRAVMREMGKAMMGTGEATGDGRALAAAEAAISNPLLDETSMRGARGLLISISGGNDLTLYEIDEAANRIRQEVDEEANVIFGATRDESLDGIIRVSVVATGIDHPLAGRGDHASFGGSVGSDAAERILAEARSRAQEATRAPTTMRRPVEPEAQAPVAPVYALSQEPTAPATIAPSQAYAPAQSYAPVEAYAPPQAYAPAAQVYAPEASWSVGGGNAAPAYLPPTPVTGLPEPLAVLIEDGPFIPPQAERAPRTPSRMPRIEELPVPAQRQLQQAAAAAQGGLPVEAKRMTLMQRLASVGGLGRREEGAAETAVQPAPAPQAARPAAPMIQAAPMMPAAPMAPAASMMATEAPRRPALPAPSRPPQAPLAAPQGTLDQHGRPQAPAPAQARSIEDDHLEIPAFLRRQSS